MRSNLSATKTWPKTIKTCRVKYTLVFWNNNKKKKNCDIERKEEKKTISQNVPLWKMLHIRDLCTRAKQFITLTVYYDLDNPPHIMDQK